MTATAQLGSRTVHRLGFGTMRLTADPDRATALAVLRRAVELGVDHLDTAAFYVSPGGTLGVGSGEKRWAAELIRAALHPYAEHLVIATKVVAVDGSDPALLRARVHDNLRLLGVERLDVVNLRLRDRDAAASLGEHFAALAGLRDEGLIGELGISNVHRHHLDEALTIAPVVCVQNAYGLELRRPGDAALLAECGRRGIAFVPFFSVAGTGRERGAGREQGTGGERGAGTDAAAAGVAQVAAAHGITAQQVRLAWTLHQGDHVLAIPGTGSIAHLEQNVAAGSVRLSPADLALLG